MKGVGSVCQAGIEEVGDELLVEVLADEDELLHAVAVLVIPIATEAWIAPHEVLQLIFGHRGIPLASVADADLFASLFEDVAGILFVVEIADAFGTDDALGPFAGYEFVEESEVKGTTAIVDVGSDAVFLSLTLIVVMVVMMMLMPMMVFMFMLIVVVMVMMLMLIVVIIIIVIIVLVFVVMLFNLLNPGGGCGNLVEVEHIGIQYLIEFHVTIVAVDNLGLGLEGTDNLSDAAQFLWADLGGLVQQHDVAEFNLLDDEVLDILLVDVLTSQVKSAAEFVSHAEGIDDGHDTVE